MKKPIVASLFLIAAAYTGIVCAAMPANITLKVLTANVGNADLLNCGQKYHNKLCLMKWEKDIADGIAALTPDIVALQEVFDIKWCDKMPPEKNKNRVCYKYKEREPLHQARRLLGPDYTIVCDGRSGFECLGVRKSIGEVKGCAAGDICLGAAGVTHDLPADCDPNPVIFGIDVDIKGTPVRVVNAHPSASNRKCRAESLRRMFEGYGEVPPLAAPDRTNLVMGDMNVDPYNWSKNYEDVAVWHRYVGGGLPFHTLSGIAEHDPPYPTAAGSVIDHFISNFAQGKCTTLGAAPGTKRLDGYPVGKPIQDAPDHLAIFCEIEIPAAADAGKEP